MRNNFLKIGAVLIITLILCFPENVFGQCTGGTIAADQTICTGGDPSAFTESQAATGTGTLVYQWQLSTTDCSSNFSNISGTNSTTYDPPSGLTTTTYYRRITTDANSCVAVSNCLTVTVDAQPTVSDQPNQTQCDNGSFTMTQSTPSVGTGEWTLISGSATITNSSSPTTTITGVAAGSSATVRWTVTNGTCSAFDDVTVTNSQAVTTANAGTDQTQCNSGSFTLAGNSPSVGNGTWTVQSGTATITTPSSATSGVTGVPSGTTAVLRWTIVNGACSSFDDVSLTNDAQPSVSDQANQTQCDNGSFTMTQSTPSVGTGEWTLVSGSATITNSTSPTTTITGVAAGSSATVRWTVTNGTCSSFDDVTITNSQAVTVANAGTDQAQCNSGSFTLAGNSPTVGTGTWTVQSGTATITTPSSATSGVTGVPSGTTAVLRWTIVNGACSSFDDVSLTNDAQPSVSDQANQTQCDNGSFTMTQSTPSVGTGEWTLISGSATITNSSSPTTTITGVAAGSSATVRWTVTNGTCSAFDDVTITNSQAVTVANAGTDQTQCNNGSFTLAGNSPSVGTGTWTVQSGIATITTPSSATSGVTGVPSGTTAVLRWTIVNGACSSFDEVSLTNSESVTPANAGTDQTQCNSGNFTLAGNSPTVGTGTWTVQSGTATITNSSSPTSTVTGVPAGSTAVLRWTIVNGACSSFDDISLTNDAQPSVSDQANQNQCDNGSFTMTQSTPSVGSGQWTLISGSATITNASSPTTTVTGVAAGSSATVRWTVTNGTCSAFDDVTVTNSQAVTVANADTDQTQCNSGSFTLAGNSPSVGTGTWTVQSGTATITNSSSPTSTVTGVPAGTTAVLRWTIVNGACSSFDEVSLTNSESVTPANAGADQSQCNNGSFTLAGNSPSVGTGTWTVQSGTATITNSSSPTSTVTGVPAGTTAVLRWTIVNGACSSFDEVSLTNSEAVTPANAGTDQSQCNSGSFTLAANSPTVGTGTWTVQSGTATITNASSPTSTVTGVPAGTTAVLRWTIVNGACSSFDDVSLTNNQNPSASTTQSNVSCNGGTDGSIDLTVTGGTTPYTYAWTGTGVNATEQDQTGLAAGTYNVTVTDANGCVTTASATITQPAAALAATITSQTNVLCYGNATGAIDLSVSGGTSGYTYMWSNLAETQDLTGLVAGTYTVTVTDANGCVTTASATVTEPAVLSASAVASPTACADVSTGTIDLTVNGGIIPYSYLWNNGSITEDLVNQPAGNYSVTITDSNGCTTTANATISVVDNVDPIAICQNVTLQLNSSGVVTLSPSQVDNGSNDLCGIGSIVLDITSFDCGDIGQNIVTLTVTDVNGNTSTCTAMVTVQDNIAPIVIAPNPMDLECSSNLPDPVANINGFLLLAGASATDNCTPSNSLLLSSTTGTLAGDDCNGTITRVYIITDANGNSTTVNHIFNVSDNTAPTATNPTSLNVQCIASVPAADITVVTDEADNCDATPTVTHIGDTNNGGTGCVASPYIVTRTYRVTDDCGNTVEVTQTITAVDNTAPVVTAPAATELECSTAIPAPATNIAQYLALTGANATDNCTAQGSLSISSTTGSMVGTNCNGTITRTYTIVDACGNATTANHVFNVSDDTPPTAQTPAPLGVQCISDIPAPNILTVLGELDNCDITPTVSFVSDSNNGGSGCSGSPYIVTRTYSITDDCDNTAYVVQTITAIDNTAPVVTAPTTTELECSTTLPAAATTIAEYLAITGSGATDNCTSQGSLTVSSITGALVGTECTGTITRTYTITDACGNTSTANHVFNVSDNTAPTASNPAPVSVQCIADVPVPDVSVVVGEADNCDATPTVMHLSDSNNGGTGCTGSPYIVTRTYSVTDDCGNTINVVQTITAIDNTAPVVTAPAPTELECSTALPVAATTITEYLAIAGSGATDNCTAQGSLIVTSVTGGLVGTECTGTITRTYTITDACGNATTANHVFNVSDNTAPTASNPAPIGVQCIADVPIPDVLVVIDEADNCDATPTVTHLSDSNNGGSGCAASPYIVTRTYRVTDDCGNTINVVQTITAIDNIAPVVTGTITATTVEGCDANYAPAAQTTVAGLESLLGDLEISDACTADGSLVVTSSQTTSGTCPVVITRTYRVTDACGNTSMDIVHTINVDDTQAPTFTAPSNTTILKDASCNYNANPSITGDVTNEADNCDVTLNATFSDAVANGSCQGQSIITRTWSLTDDCGNITTHTQTITALDVTAPVLTAPTATEIECSTGIPAAATTIAQFLALPGANAIDACAIQSSLMVSSTTGPLTGTQCNGSITRTYSISDPCGNVSFIDHVFNVSDNTAPVPAAGTILACYQSQALAEAAAIANTTATDNCTGSLTFTAATTDGPDCDSTITVTVTDACGNTATVSYQTQINCQPVQLKVFLEGPYDPVNNNLKTTLNNDHLLPGQNTSLLFVGDTPSGQPYNDAPWNYNGNTGMNFGDPPYGTIPYPTDVVDWILVTVRQDGILPANNIWTCAGWVHSDGNVSFPEECPMPAIEITSDYYILVQHRNHLGILSPSFVNIECGGTILRWDFTTSDSYKPAFRVGQKQIEPGVWGMFGSNGEQVNSIATINSPDRTRWRSQQGMTGYLKGDYDLNRSANSADETKWKINQNKTSGIIFY